MAIKIVDGQRRLDPIETISLRWASGAVLSSPWTSRRGIHHQPDIGADMRSRAALMRFSVLARSSRQKGSATILMALRPSFSPRSMSCGPRLASRPGGTTVP